LIALIAVQSPAIVMRPSEATVLTLMLRLGLWIPGSPLRGAPE